MVKNAFYFFFFFFSNLRYQIYVISGLALKMHFKNLRVAFCSPIFLQYIGMGLPPSNCASARVT